MTQESGERVGAAAGAEPLPLRERRLLSQWLREWRCEQVLGEGGLEYEPAASAAAAAAAGAPVAPAIRPPRRRHPTAVRQIRLLHPSDTGSSSRPLFVAIFAQPTPFLFRAAPFGRFAAPAVPGELETGRPQIPLRVLCVWNARVLHAAVCERGWPVGRLSAGEAAAAAALDGHDSAETWLSGYEALTGPRLRHPADPRHTYLRQETELMDRVCREGRRVPGDSASLAWPLALGLEEGAQPVRRAAEVAPSYGRRLSWRVPAYGVHIQVEPPSDPGQPCGLTVRAEEGVESDLLDGAVLAGARRVVRVANGRALVLAGDLIGGLRLYDAGGLRIRICEEE